MDFCKQKNVVYVCKLRDEPDDKFIIKIGSSQNIKERFLNIQNDYKMVPILLNIFDCMAHTQFENWIRKHEFIKPLFFPIKRENGTITRETFLVNEEQYNNIIKLMQTGVSQFTDINKLLELEEIKNLNKKLDITLEEIRLKQYEINLKQDEMNLRQNELKSEQYKIQLKIQENNIMIQFQENTKEEPELEPSLEEEKEPEPIIPDNLYVKTRENARSPKVYQYDASTLELIKMYDSVISVIRDFNSSSGSALREAAKNNTIYKGYRWMMVDRNATEDPTLLPTVEIRTQSIEYIAMIDIKQTKILEVFSCQKEAAKARNLVGFSTISRSIKQGSISSGHYWNIFNRCSDEMQNEYLKTNKLPEPYIKNNGITVVQINPVNNEEIKTYDSITEVLKKHQMSRGSLNKASKENIVHNGFKWKILYKE